MKKALIALTILFLSSSAAAADLTVEILDEQGNVQNADLLLEQDGNTVDEGTTLNATVNNGENYNLTQQVSGLEIKIVNLSVQEDLDLRPRILNKETPEGDQYLTDLDPFYFVNQSFSFDYTSIDTGKSFEPDRIARCSSFSGFECDNWEINSTQDYTDNSNSLETETYTYRVDSFSAYSTGTNASLPKVENIEIFNVTDTQDQRNNGDLVDEGLNKTFTINQKSSNLYRFEFNVSNQGSNEWSLTTEDVLSHSGLNQSWTVEDIYYRLNGEKDGGAFENGVVDWNTGNGGTVIQGESLSAEYVVNITQDSTSLYSQSIKASSTEGAQDEDFHELKVRKLGFLKPELDRPVNNSVVQNNREFVLNGTVSCVEGDCGEVSSTPRRNSSMGQIEFTGDIFEQTSFSSSGCGNLLQNQECDVEWSVNATGDKNTFHKVDFLAESNYTKIDSESTNTSTVEIRDILMVDLDWNSIDFGLLDPGERDRPAENNSEGYNLTVQQESNKVDNLWLKGSDLVHTDNSNYSIGIGNMSYNNSVNNPENSTSITEDYSLLDTDIAPGTTKTFYYWLDVPLGILRGAYTGSITFKANQSQS